jgi:D-alanyl-D-alanine carboxypeptidase
MRSFRLFEFLLVGIAVGLAGCGVPVTNDFADTQSVDVGQSGGFEPYKNERFQSTLDRIFAQGSDSNTRWSVAVRAFGPQGQKLALYSQSAARVVKPASTMKILTSWTAFQKISSASQIGSERYLYIREMMKYSDNYMADQVLASCGGVSASYAMLTSFGIQKSANLSIIDGSGLSYSNKLGASDLVQILTEIRASDKMKAFRSLLPVGGIDGTLSSRLGHVPGTIAAKTGTLTTDPTTALAGYGDSRSGWQIAFAILGDSVPSVDNGRYTIDTAVEEIIRTLNYFPTKTGSQASIQ